MFDWAGLLGSIGFGSISLTLIILGVLSQRLGRVTNAPAYYLGFYLGGCMVGCGMLGRLIHINDPDSVTSTLQDSGMWVMVYNGFPAIGITLGLILAWRYWSWLLAERD